MFRVTGTGLEVWGNVTWDGEESSVSMTPSSREVGINRAALGSVLPQRTFRVATKRDVGDAQEG